MLPLDMSFLPVVAVSPYRWRDRRLPFVATLRRMRFRRTRGPRRFTSGAAVAAAAEAAAGVDVLPPSPAAAFFDVDNTAARCGDLLLRPGMYARKYFRARDIARFGYQQVRFRIGAEDPDHVDNARSAALSFIVNRSVGELKDSRKRSSRRSSRRRSGRAPEPSRKAISTKANGSARHRRAGRARNDHRQEARTHRRARDSG